MLGLLWFALLFCVERSWLTSQSVYQNLLVSGALLVFFGALYLARVILARRREPAFLAAAIEGARPALQDRLNTLVFLDAKENARVRRHFSPAIAGQTVPVLGGRAAHPLYPRVRAWAHLAAGLACVGGAVWFDHHYNPQRNLVSAGAALAPVPTPPPTDAPFELQSKNPAEAAGKEAWGEVRIVEPGRDQKLTKLDVVPLRIEMAARDPFTAHEWVTSVNGEPEVVHPLDPAPEPCFAAYSVLFYLDELKVSDWDVISYYARAQTSKGNAYGSQIYFIEIRPFRDDLLKGMPGGAGGKAYQMLSDLTALTTEQSRLLRATHQHEQMAYDRPELQQEDRRKLASSESDLAAATDHVYSKIASELENANVGPVLSHLDSAEGHMNRSVEALRSDVVGEGKNRQQQALMELVATRKALQKVISEHPENFGGNGSGGDDDDTPTTDRAKNKLKALQQVAEFRDQEKAAQAAVAKLAADEKQLSNLPYRAYQDRSKDLVKQQAEMNKRLDDLNQENPDLFAHSKEALDTARQGMQEAKTALGNKSNTYETRTSLTHAVDDLNDLNKSLGANNSRRDLERAYAMKKAVDQSARALHAAEAKPDALTPGQADALAAGARQVTKTLKEVSGQNFGPALSDALSPAKQAELDTALQRFQSGKGQGRAQAAAAARANLEGVSQAFDASRPPTVQKMTGQDALGGRGGSPGQGQGQGGGALDALLEKLQSLALQEENGHHLSPEARTKERAELLGEMEAEIPKELGKTDAAAALLAEAEKELTKKGNMPVDPEVLKHLQEKLESMQASASEKNAALAADGTSVADASRAPASYRQRLQRYYETLSRVKP